MKQGFLITFEGPEGCGKSTQIIMLTDYLGKKGLPVLALREPGSTEVGEQIRDVLLNRPEAGMCKETELLLFIAARAQFVQQEIIPALEKGTIVLCDRFGDSSLAYQGYGRGIDLQVIKRLNRFATGSLVPDLTFLLDIPVKEGLKRREGSGKKDRLDKLERVFHERVRKGYQEMAEKEPQRWRHIDANRCRIAVFAQIVEAVEGFFKQHGLEGQFTSSKERR